MKYEKPMVTGFAFDMFAAGAVTADNVTTNLPEAPKDDLVVGDSTDTEF